MSEARIASDGGEDAVKRAASVLEQAGAPKDYLKAAMKMRRRKKEVKLMSKLFVQFYQLIHNQASYADQA